MILSGLIWLKLKPHATTNEVVEILNIDTWKYESVTAIITGGFLKSGSLSPCTVMRSFKNNVWGSSSIGLSSEETM